jgi:hypothetical protein
MLQNKLLIFKKIWITVNLKKIDPYRYLVLASFMAIGIYILSNYIERRILNLAKQQNLSQQSCSNSSSSGLFVRTELFFGLSKPDRSKVTEQEFQRFIDREVTPRFPDGLTLLSGSGQFKNSGNQIVKEPANLLILIYPQNRLYSSKVSPEINRSQKVEQIRNAYKQAFQQESVLRSDEPSCISF